jgi:hypothetical protein
MNMSPNKTLRASSVHKRKYIDNAALRLCVSLRIEVEMMIFPALILKDDGFG